MTVNSQQRKQKEKRIDELQKETDNINQESVKLLADIDKYLPQTKDKLNEVNARKEKLNGFMSDFKWKLNEYGKQSKFFRETNSVRPVTTSGGKSPQRENRKMWPESKLFTVQEC